MTALSANGYLSNAARTQGEVKADLEATKDFIRDKFGSSSIAITSIASASTVDLGTAASDSVLITGTTGPIISFGTAAAGVRRFFRTASTPSFTHSTALQCPGGISFTASAGTTGEAESLGSGNWIIRALQLGTGVGSMVLVASGTVSGAATADIPLPAGYKYFRLIVREVIPATNNTDLYMRVSQNSGASYLTSGYDYGANFTNATSGTTGFYSASSITTGAVLLGQSLPNANGYNLFEVTIFPGNASRLPRFNYQCGWIAQVPATISQNGAGQSGSAVGAATNVRLLMSSGNISLVYDLYGFV